MIMLSYHNDVAVKAKYVARFAAHRIADEVIQGTGFTEGRGCFVGCCLDKYNHALFPVELGWPQWLAYLADTIFEGLPRDEAPQFGTDLLAAVPVGVDLEPLRNQFLLTVQCRNLARLVGNDEPYAVQCRAAIEQVIAYLSGAMPDEEERSAGSVAWSAAQSVAESTARSAARTVESAAWSSRSSAKSVGWSSWSSAKSAAESAGAVAFTTEFRSQRDDLLELLRGMSKVAV